MTDKKTSLAALLRQIEGLPNFHSWSLGSCEYLTLGVLRHMQKGYRARIYTKGRSGLVFCSEGVGKTKRKALEVRTPPALAGGFSGDA